jgi:MerR family transcriptional regulator, light-induced transcriptional regulator
VDDDEAAILTIGTVAERTGLGTPVLRAWETRYGFPRPGRTPSGQRRYRERDVADILRVVADRNAGLSLEAAIERARRSGDESAPSLFATLRRHHPGLPTHVLTTRAMLAVSRAIEDECCARADRPVLLAAFQEVRHYERAGRRWQELTRTSVGAVAFADFPEVRTPPGGPIEVPLRRDAPLRREWAVICDASDSAAVLSGWERPTAPGAPASARRFEATWSADPAVVRRASRHGLALAAQVTPAAAPLVDSLVPLRADPTATIARATALTNRIVAYLDASPPG